MSLEEGISIINQSSMANSLGISSNAIVNRAVTAAAANIKRRSTQSSTSERTSKQYSVSIFYSIATEQDIEIEDELAKVQKTLRELKANISIQSKNNFLLEKDVRTLDSRIALLIQNRMALDENELNHNQFDEQDGSNIEHYPDNRKMQLYGNLFFLLQSEPRYIASLCRLVSLPEIDTLLQTVMFTLYGNQYESREENLLLTMFQNVLAAQFEAALEFGSLLRANTPVSRMLTTYTRRGPGQSYLKSVLSQKINELIEQKDLNLQINPLKVYDEVVARMKEEGTLPPDFNESVTPEIAASNSEVQAIIIPRLETLIETANDFLTTIIDSLNNVPYGIRWVCKQIRSLTKRKYPNANETAISSLIGGFFFLRFINPAIVTPQAYMLIDSYPGSNPRVTLTLIAKMLQNLANKPTYAKESYMIPTNPFVTANKQRINQFLNDLCEVSDFYESLEMDQYMALSRKDIYINITPNELYSTQALINQNLHKLAPDPMHHLHILLEDLGHTPKQVPRQVNKPVQLPLYSRWETSPLLASQQQLSQQEEQLSDSDLAVYFSPFTDNSITQSDILYMETKSTFVQIMRSLPHTMKLYTDTSSSLDLLRVVEAAGAAKDKQLVNKGLQAQSMLQDLEDAGIVSNANHYELLVQEIQQELNHLGDLKHRVVLEIESLEQVFKTIQDHNDYLQSQLEAYKAYLQNVRMKSSGTIDCSGGRRRSSLAAVVGFTQGGSGHVSPTSPQPIQQQQQQQQQPQQEYLPQAHLNGSNSSISQNASSTNSIASSSSSIAKKKSSGPFKFSHQQLEKEGVIVQSEVPEYRRANIYLMIQSPITGTFVISIHYKGREKPILEIDLKLDDLLEKQKDHINSLDLEYVKLNISKILQLLNKSFKGKSR